MMSRIWAFIRRLFGHRDNTDVTPGPIVITDPTPTPVDPPAPQPLPVVELWPRTLHLWCEASDATKYDRCNLHGNVILHAVRGTSAKARTIRCIHPWYEPFKSNPSQTVLDWWFKEAKDAGCIGVSVDWEGWIKSRAATERIVAAAEAAKVPLVLVPKWTLDPSGEYYCGCQTQAEVVALLNTWRVPAVLPWLYMGDTTWRRATLQSTYRDNGYTGQLIGMTDGGMREGQRDRAGNRYNSVSETWDFMSAQYAAGQSVGLFNVPTDHRSLRYAIDMYRGGAA
jgi:hypothetical protein